MKPTARAESENVKKNALEIRPYWTGVISSSSMMCPAARPSTALSEKLMM